MTNLDKAREWAEIIFTGPANARARATAEIIRSLPDQWVSAEEVREALEGCDKMTYPYEVIEHIEKTLLAPPLPTLADMTPEEREACQWMQAKIPDSDQIHVIASVWPTGSFLWRADGHSFHRNNDMITPLPGPKLQWPGSEPESTHFDNLPDEAKQVMKESIEDFKAGKFVDFDSSPRPEDVPAGEPWIVEYDGIRHVGAREKGAVTYLDWALARLDGTECVAARDREITLVSRLVPESHTLPEGMRLADHETYGRVVVSPEINTFSQYLVFRLDGNIYRATDTAVHKAHLTFLDGETDA